ncbi:MAG TPA: DASS family sodium-coupled anion symporter [Pirellulaceae bacterium]|nr:DASS family sodium-coupled anion symporter [Pirellulaceae bacterium]
MNSLRDSASDAAAPASRFVARLGLGAGPLLALAAFLALRTSASDLAPAAQATAAVGVLMAVWWMTEAIPLEATSLLPLVLFPVLGATKDIKAAAAPYADESIFLYLGGFLLALAVEKWGLHRRLALATLVAVGTRPAMLVGGFMLATALVSMWISNTATTLMMLPIGLSVVHLLSDKLASGDSAAAKADAANLSIALLLGIAYAASIGGLATLIGTPPNAVFKGFMESKGIPIGFGRWMLFALPLSGVYLLLAWLVMTRLFPVRAKDIPGGSALIRQELNKLGWMTRGEWTVLIVFAAAVAGWLSLEPLYQTGWLPKGPNGEKRLSDAVIGMAAALALFVIPVDWKSGRFALDWRTASRVPWGVLLLFGGGLSLAKAMTDTKLDVWIGQQVQGLAHLPLPVLVVIVVTGVVLFSELASNLATATTLLPVLFAAAVQLQLDPLVLCVPAILAASCGFMLPVATPPNAIVFGTGHITMRQMMRAGLWLDLIGIVLIPLATWTLGKWVLGV